LPPAKTSLILPEQVSGAMSLRNQAALGIDSGLDCQEFNRSLTYRA